MDVRLPDGRTIKNVPDGTTREQLMSKLGESFEVPKRTQDLVSGDPERAASAKDIAVASLANDPQAQIRYFARQRGIPEDRYGVVDGNVVYRDQDDKLYSEVPGGWSPSAILGRLASQAGNSIPMATGTAAGLASAPLLLGGPVGVLGSAAIAGAGAAGGQGIREGLAGRLMGQDVSLGRIATEGAWGAAGQGIGGALTKHGNRNVARDLAQLDTPAADSIRRKARIEGISLTPAEETGLASLRAEQKYLSNTPESQNIMQGFYKKRSGEVDNAIRNYLSRISPVDSIEEAGSMAVKGANAAVDTETAKRAAQASPLYKEAFDASAYLTPTPDGIEFFKRPALKDALAKATRIASNEGIELGNPTNNLRGLHYTKMALDDMIEGSRSTGLGSTERRALVKAKEELLDMMDAVSPKYQEARKVYSDLSPGVERIKEGMTGKIADLPQTREKNATQMLLGNASGPKAITETMGKLTAADPVAAQAVKRAYLQDAFEKSMQETVEGNANVSGQFHKRLLGNFQTRARVQAALSPAEYGALNDLDEVLTAASSVKVLGSDTAWNQAVQSAEMDKAKPLIAKIVKNVNPLQALKSFDEWQTTRNASYRAEAMARAITQPGAAQTLKQLKMLPRKSIAFRIGIGHLLSGQVGNLTEAVLLPPDDSAPE